jgi:pseudouridylate synthase
MRIQKYIAETGLCSRRKAEEYIRDGKITVNGKVAVIGQNVEENDIIKYNEKVLKKEELEYYLLNKPLRIYMYK